MKKMLLFIVSVCSFTILFAQSVANRWKNLMIAEVSPWDITYMDYEVRILKDTIINDLKYESVYYCYEGKKTEYECAIRYSEDYEKLFIVPQNYKDEFLLCDFSLNVGDICNAYWSTNQLKNEWEQIGSNDYPIIMPWKIISNEIIDGRHYVKMQLVIGEYEETQSKWETMIIQGIGSPYFPYLLPSSPYCAGCATNFTLCAFFDKEQLYSYDLTSVGIINECSNWRLINNPSDIDVIFPEENNSNKIQKKFVNGSLQILLPNGRRFDSLGREIK